MNDQNTDMHLPEGHENTHASHNGVILSILIIALVLIFGGLYLWGGVIQQSELPIEQSLINNEPETPRADADAQILETLSPSDELDAIDADLNSTNLDSIDTDLTTIDAELGPDTSD